VIAAPQIGIQPSRQHLRKHARCSAAALYPPHECRVHVARRVRQDQLREFAIDGRQFSRAFRQLRAKSSPDIGRYGLPGRTPANLFQIVEHIVEHPVAQRPGFRPVRGIERGRIGYGVLLQLHVLLRFSMS